MTWLYDNDYMIYDVIIYMGKRWAENKNKSEV